MGKAFFGAVVGGLVVVLISLSTQRWQFHLVPTGMTYADLAATLLAASALILATLGFFIAVLAVLGWSQFRGLIRKSATETVKSHIDNRLQDGDLRAQIEGVATGFIERQFQTGSLRKLIEERVDYIIYSGSTSRSDQDRGDENLEE